MHFQEIHTRRAISGALQLARRPTVLQAVTTDTNEPWYRAISNIIHTQRPTLRSCATVIECVCTCSRTCRMRCTALSASLCGAFVCNVLTRYAWDCTSGRTIKADGMSGLVRSANECAHFGVSYLSPLSTGRRCVLEADRFRSDARRESR